MKHGAYFITSGIINTKEQEVVDAFKKNPELEIVEVNHDGEWVNVTAAADKQDSEKNVLGTERKCIIFFRA